MTPGEMEAMQNRFSDLWLKVQEGSATPEEEKELLDMQEEYWTNRPLPE